VIAQQLELPPPSLQDGGDDLARLRRGLADRGYDRVELGLPTLRRIGEVLRQSEWSPWVLLERLEPFNGAARLVELSAEPLRPIGLALDIGTTTVSAYLVDLASGEVLNSAASTTVRSRPAKTSSPALCLRQEMACRSWAHECGRPSTSCSTGCASGHRGGARDIHKVVVVGNTTMIHLFLGLPPSPSA
jgi:uncharacterized 2Fe-2S/4Fe-4S cluster protein (DUF4445 family)